MIRKFYATAALALLTTIGAQAQLTQETIVFPRGSVWKYLDNGSDQGTAWYDVSFNDAAWASGPAELGYGDGNEATVVSFGPSSGAKYPCTYFRSSFNLTALPTGNQRVVVKLRRDDGAVIYINGQEVVRDNMPSGTITYQTWATGTVDGSNESTYFTFTIPATALVVGNNVIAAQIHQDRPSSSDISFDLEIAFTEFLAPLECDSHLDSLHISRFVSVLPSVQPDSLRIPATHTFQMLVQEGDPYTDPNEGVTKGLFDFTGFVPKNGTSSTEGWLSLNHELGSWPAAGVSMMTLNFDTANSVWNVTNNTPVDFSVVYGTGRNCSGAVTPWGTVITAEETLPSADVNGDGFQDVGWLVELDPETATVRDHRGNNRPQKLWKLGRMSHENCVVNPWDRKTVYLGNDENPGYIFRFIADNPEDLTAGQLYVLKLDGPLNSATTGSWVGIPNTTPADCNNARSFAASVGATNFDQIEDVEISPLDSMIYFTSKASSRVYRFRDEGVRVSRAEVFVGNSDFIYNIRTEDDIIPEQWRGGVDNLTFDSKGNLYVIQDGGRNHIWMVPPCHTQMEPAVKLFAVTPAGCEPTGMTMTPDDKYMFVSMQHPSSSNATEQLDASGRLVKFNRESCIVIARKEFLGPEAIKDTTGTEEPKNIGGLKAINAINVYPNPTDGNVSIAVDVAFEGNAMISITAVNGADVRLISRRLQKGNNQVEVDMKNLPAGMYFATVSVNGQSSTVKIVKQ